MTPVDAIVVGGGPAGMSAALYLARYNRAVALFDGGQGRSTFHQVNHNYLGFPDGVDIRRLRELGRAQLAQYPHVTMVDHNVERVSGNADDGFTVASDGREWTGRVLVLATGVKDDYPRFRDWDSYVGRSMFWCMACDGYESRGRNILVVGCTDAAAAEALQLSTISSRVRVLTNSDTCEMGTAARRRLDAAGVPVLTDRIEDVVGADGQLTEVRTASGTVLDLDVLFSAQGSVPQSALAGQLGVALSGDGYLQVDSEQKTSLPGVYAAGDVTALHSHQVTTAVHEGAQAASAANYFLYPPSLLL